ncbi:MAG: glucosamine-6-phosphate deaminase [Clostridiales bacterium]|nr:glucosamine-6-phosphate deaminase [Clostridiales bacterium]
MQFHIVKTPELAAVAASTIIAAAILEKPGLVLGLPTGSSPVGTYRELIRMHREGLLDFSGVSTYNLDEYVGLDGTHPQSYRRFMDENLFEHVNIPRENTHVPLGTGPDPEGNARDYEAAIASAGGIDLQFMGIGRNGHIGFNEPSDAFADATAVIALTPSTVEANKRYFASAGDVPRTAVSMGVGTILRARRALLLATGADKAEAVRGMVRGPITPMLPASALRLHQNCLVILDEAAAALL